MNRTGIEWSYNRGWIEALIDSEGSISLLKEKRPRYKAGLTYKPRLNIGNKDKRLLIKAQRIIGGDNVDMAWIPPPPEVLAFSLLLVLLGCGGLVWLDRTNRRLKQEPEAENG
jgi:hypothetical protein